MTIKQLKELLNKYPDHYQIELNSTDSNAYEIIQIIESEDAAFPNWLYITFDKGLN